MQQHVVFKFVPTHLKTAGAARQCLGGGGGCGGCGGGGGGSGGSRSGGGFRRCGGGGRGGTHGTQRIEIATTQHGTHAQWVGQWVGQRIDECHASSFGCSSFFRGVDIVFRFVVLVVFLYLYHFSFLFVEEWVVVAG